MQSSSFLKKVEEDNEMKKRTKPKCRKYEIKHWNQSWGTVTFESGDKNTNINN